MTTFDGWETRLNGDAMALPAGQLSDEVLMHFRTKGSKNGVRRYQQEDGTWTPLGLRERKEREGWGESRKERKAAKAVAKSEKKAAKAERRSEKAAQRVARIERRAHARAEAKRAFGKRLKKEDLSGLSDEELKKKISRVKMEQEYRELTKSPVLKIGEKVIDRYLKAKDNKAKREDEKARREAEKEKRILENNRLKSEIVKAQEETKKAAKEVERAKYDYKKMKQDRKAGLKQKRKKELVGAKLAYEKEVHAKKIARGKAAGMRILGRRAKKEVKRKNRYNKYHGFAMNPATYIPPGSSGSGKGK